MYFLFLALFMFSFKKPQQLSRNYKIIYPFFGVIKHLWTDLYLLEVMQYLKVINKYLFFLIVKIAFTAFES